MAQLHWLSNYQAIDANGDILVGAKLHTYEADAGTTNKATYSNDALSSANANPIISDSNGYFGAIFVKPEDYKFVLKDADDNTIWTLNNANNEEDVQRPVRWVGTATGTDTILLTATDVPTSYINGQRFRFIAAANNTGAVTVNVNSIGARDLVRAGGIALAANDIIANYPYEIEYVSAIDDFVIRGVDGLFSGSESAVVPADADVLFFLDASNGNSASKAILAGLVHQAGLLLNVSWSVTVSGNAITVALKTAAGADPSTSDPVRIGFRSATLTTSATEFITVTSALSMTVSAGSTLGFSNSESGRIYIGLINNSGTVELCVWRSLNGTGLFNPSEYALHSTTAEGGAGAADSAAVIYSTTARSSVPLIVGGYFDIQTSSTAGNWSNAPTAVQVMGPGIPRTGDIVQSARDEDSVYATSTTSVPFDNTIPQRTEGNELMSVSVTPSSAVNLLDFSAQAVLGHSNNAVMIMSLFSSSDSDAIATVVNQYLTDEVRTPSISARQVSGTTSSTTFSVRAGSQNTESIYFNGDNAAAVFGGACSSFLEVKEVFV